MTVTRCNEELDVLISLRAVGGLDAAEAARLEAHLEQCERCRAEAAADAAVLGLARLPPLSDAEQRAAAVRPGRALAALRARDVRRTRAFRWTSVLAVAAAAVLAVLAPVYLRSGPTTDGQQVAEQAEVAATWESPDLEGIWDDTAVLDLDGAAWSDSVDLASAAVAAASF